jgi:hypothetical protein
MNSTMKSKLAALCMGAVLMLGVVACDMGGTPPTPVVNPTSTTQPTVTTQEPTAAATTQAATQTPQSSQNPTVAPTVQSVATVGRVTKAAFASYVQQPSSVSPSVAQYTVQPGLANVTNAATYELSPALKSLIEKNGFGAQMTTGEFKPKQFYQLYESIRYEEKPVFVTTDSVLHVYHLMFDKLLRSTETNYLISNLMSLNAAMQEASQQQYTTLKGTSGETAAKRNLAYFAVAARLIDPTAAVPAEVQAEVTQELSLIDAHAGLAQSAVMGIGGKEFMEDYGQYNPRGHYTRSEDLKKYFRAMMWYGRITFRLDNQDETRSALLLTQALQTAKTPDGKSAADAWAKIYEPTSFFVGGADDLTYRDYAPLIAQTFGANADAKAFTDDTKLAQFLELSKSLAAPRINSMFVWITEDKEQVTKGWRMMGQRFTLDEYVFGQLIWREVGTIDNQRLLPKGLDVPAAFGSQEAYKILSDMGETKFANYPEQMDKVRGQIKGLPTSQWTENLYWSWLYTFRPLLAPKAPDSGYPSFMTNDAWTRKGLNTVLGSWTELKHDTLLYAKQVMAEMGGGPPNLPKGYVEPEPEFYARIAALVAMTRDGLLSRGLLEKTADQEARSDYNSLNDLEKLALDLKKISEKELSNQALTTEEYELIDFYGGRLEKITLASSDPAGEGGVESDLNDQDSAVVADVASEPNGFALEEGTGRIMEVYVVVPIEGKLLLAKGGIYSQYEFTQPTGDRLTDEAWHERLDNNQVPPQADWKTFISK